jgi:predicted nucleic acid-binding protein
VPDCLYLALAEREGAAIATADGRLVAITSNQWMRVPEAWVQQGAR